MLSTFNLFLTQIKRFTDDVIRIESRFYGWIACCALHNQMEPLPKKLNNLISILMNVSKREVAHPSSCLPILDECLNCLCELIFRLCTEKRANVHEKLTKNLIILHANPVLDCFNGLSGGNTAADQMIFDWQNRINVLDCDFSNNINMTLSSFIKDHAAQNCGKILMKICSRASGEIDQMFPVIYRAFLDIGIPDTGAQQLLTSLQVVKIVYCFLIQSTFYNFTSD